MFIIVETSDEPLWHGIICEEDTVLRVETTRFIFSASSSVSADPFNVIVHQHPRRGMWEDNAVQIKQRRPRLASSTFTIRCRLAVGMVWLSLC